MGNACFQPAVFQFLEDLTRNNDREWFLENKSRYEAEVLEPAMAFIRAFQPRLKEISPFFVASDKRVGGSLMRIYRDTRFSKDKTPYKTNVGIQFRHEFGKDVHAPGFYVHISPGDCLLGVGLWRPDSASLAQIRQAIVDGPVKWEKARYNEAFCAAFELTGERLKSAPRGFTKTHPLIDDLKLKDFVAVRNLTKEDILKHGFIDEAASLFASTRPYMRFLCEALSLSF